ncbi:MAG: radical SAM protein [Desulfovibrio sp.]|nr:radical SAM protein [Desulfovibrio sp.]
MKKPETRTFEFSGKAPAPTATYSIHIDLVDACNAACATCPRGTRILKNRRGQMPLELFSEVARKAAALGFYNAGLYNWSEPFLVRNLQEYARVVKECGMYCHLSSNLSFRDLPQLLPTLEYCDRLIVSLSGYTQPVHAINHRGTNIELVKKQLEIIGKAKQQGRITTRVDIRYFIFPHSEKEFGQFRDFGESLGLNVIAWKGHGDPTHGDVARQKLYTAVHDGTWKNGQGALPAKVCYQAVAPFIVDMHADSYLCCSQPFSPATRIGNFLEDSFELQLFRRISHPCCHGCSLKNPIAVPGHYMEWLTKGALAHYGLPAGTLRDISEEALLADRLAGKAVYFWESGGMLRRKMRVFSKCRPVCILTEDAEAPAHIAALPVRHPDAELTMGPALPVVIFAEERAREIIRDKIRRKYPRITEVYHCSSA